MIAKHISIRSVKKSSFMELVKYITNEQDKSERVGFILTTNCHSKDALVAALEVQAKQVQNTRAASDKTYHLVVSFRAGENPRQDVLRAIEDRICVGLGYGEHQRVSAVHRDTDNLHIHVAINQIHPTRLTIHKPYYDHKTLGALCAGLEAEYGLECDNHTARNRGAENRASNIEHKAGVESFLGWVQRGCLVAMQQATTWAELHQSLRAYGLEVRERGNGLVLTDQAGTFVKVSSVSRELSKARLEDRFGVFMPCDVSNSLPLEEHMAATMIANLKIGNEVAHAGRYVQRPIGSCCNAEALFETYKGEQQAVNRVRAAELEVAYLRKRERIKAVKCCGYQKREEMKSMEGSGSGKKVLDRALSKMLREEIRVIGVEYLIERQALYSKHRRLAWNDWLQSKAKHGDAQALAALRTSTARHGFKGDTLTGESVVNPGLIPGINAEGITRKGTIIYRVGESGIRDDGVAFEVPRGMSQDGIEAALRMAMYRFGERIKVHGSTEFKNLIVQVATNTKLAIVFGEHALEERRQSLLGMHPGT